MNQFHPGLSRMLEAFVCEEMQVWQLGGVAVALVNDRGLLFAEGFGTARRESVFRVGSISKLFNALAVMQQVEAGKLDLDGSLPAELRPRNPFPETAGVTLRQTLCHRSGLPREPTRGGYFDDSEPGLKATVSTSSSCVLVTAPGAKTRYSNFGPTLAGYMVERSSRLSFEDYQQKHLLAPLGMSKSGWSFSASRQDLLPARMRVTDGLFGWNQQAAPQFDLGTIPAGNLFSTVEDLGRFASRLLAGGAGLVKRETLLEMWRPQLTSDSLGYGLGFQLGEFKGRRTIGDNGAVYGYSSSLLILPEEKLAAVVLCNEDIVIGRTQRIAHKALSLLLTDGPKEEVPRSPEFDVADLPAFTGDYESLSCWARLEVFSHGLLGTISGQRTHFSPVGQLQFLAESRIENATPVDFFQGKAGEIAGFTMGLQRFERVAVQRQPIPLEWRRFLGSYGPGFIPVVISGRHGHLYAMTENMLDYRLTPESPNVFGLPAGLYTDERVIFSAGKDGVSNAINFANMDLNRLSGPDLRSVGPGRV